MTYEENRIVYNINYNTISISQSAYRNATLDTWMVPHPCHNTPEIGDKKVFIGQRKDVKLCLESPIDIESPLIWKCGHPVKRYTKKRLAKKSQKSQRAKKPSNRYRKDTIDFLKEEHEHEISIEYYEEEKLYNDEEEKRREKYLKELPRCYCYSDTSSEDWPH